MLENNSENIFREKLEYSYLSLIANKLRIGIVGGGESAAIKAKHFLKKECVVEVLALKFNKDIIEMAEASEGKLKLIKGNFYIEFLRDKHIIIISLKDNDIISDIKKYCEENYKIYIDTSDFTNGMGVIPVEKSTKNLSFALNTKYGNPKGAVFIANKVHKTLEEYDKFIEYTGKIRNKAKKFPEYKKEIITFIVRDEFKKFFDEGKSEEILRDNFPRNVVDFLLK